jgi:hypothetical protein
MNNTMSRRDALKLGTNAAVSAAITPLLAGESVDASLVKGSVEAGATPPTIPSLAKTPESAPDICFMRAVDMARLIREKKLSAREVDAGAFEADRAPKFQGQCDCYAGCGRAEP